MVGCACAFDTEVRPAALQEAAMLPTVRAPLRKPRRASLNPADSAPPRPSAPLAFPDVVFSSMTAPSMLECTAPAHQARQTAPSRRRGKTARGGEASAMPHAKADESRTCEMSVVEHVRRTKALELLLPG